MDLKDELENELAMAILIEKRLAGKLDKEGGRELIVKIKVALSSESSTHEAAPLTADAVSAG